MTSLTLSGWRPFYAFRDYGVDRAYLRRIGATAERIFRDGVASPKSGRLYARGGGRVHRASAPGEYPAKDSGNHVATISHRVYGRREVVVGSGMFYAHFLRNGTSKMARRLMSDTALNRAIESDDVGVGRFARFRHGG